jgi:hypothetical protein
MCYSFNLEWIETTKKMFQNQLYDLKSYQANIKMKLELNKIMLQNYIIGLEFVKLYDYLFICTSLKILSLEIYFNSVLIILILV